MDTLATMGTEFLSKPLQKTVALLAAAGAVFFTGVSAVGYMDHRIDERGSIQELRIESALGKQLREGLEKIEAKIESRLRCRETER